MISRSFIPLIPCDQLSPSSTKKFLVTCWTFNLLVKIISSNTSNTTCMPCKLQTIPTSPMRLYTRIAKTITAEHYTTQMEYTQMISYPTRYQGDARPLWQSRTMPHCCLLLKQTAKLHGICARDKQIKKLKDLLKLTGTSWEANTVRKLFASE